MLTRRGFWRTLAGGVLAVFGVQKAAGGEQKATCAARWVAEADIDWKSGWQTDKFACYQCFIQSLVDRDITYCDITTHIYATEDGRYKSYWCDAHAPEGSVRLPRSLDRNVNPSAVIDFSKDAS